MAKFFSRSIYVTVKNKKKNYSEFINIHCKTLFSRLGL